MKKVVTIGLLGMFLLLVPSMILAQGVNSSRDSIQFEPGGRDAILFPDRESSSGDSSRSGGGNCVEGEFCNPLGSAELQDLLVKLLEIVVMIMFPIIVLAILWAGFLFVTAGGSEEKINTAKKVFFYTLIGAAIVLGAEVLSIAIQGTVGDILGR
ncbi:MAG: hypothetical protein WDZ90_00955 [Candidatus Paceibacterota bacterium]